MRANGVSQLLLGLAPAFALVVLLPGCGSCAVDPGEARRDAGEGPSTVDAGFDAGTVADGGADAGRTDAGPRDAGALDGGSGGVDAGPGDSDDDGVTNAVDNCPTVVNPRQRDSDADDVGDRCDDDCAGDAGANDAGACEAFGELAVSAATPCDQVLCLATAGDADDATTWAGSIDLTLSNAGVGSLFIYRVTADGPAAALDDFTVKDNQAQTIDLDTATVLLAPSESVTWTIEYANNDQSQEDVFPLLFWTDGVEWLVDAGISVVPPG